MSICYKSALVPSIMLYIEDKMNMYLPVTFRWLSSFTQVLEGLVLMKLGHHLKGSRVLQIGIPIALVKLDSMVIVAWNLVTVLVLWCHTV